MKQPLPHDLLWGLRPEQLPADAPAWARGALAGRVPVVVRRAPAEPGWVAVGVRGEQREQRFATWMRVADVARHVSPEAVARAGRWRAHHQPHWPAVQALTQLAPLLNEQGMAWGVTGSLGFELASGVAATHPDSDLDLLLRAPYFLSHDRARTLCSLLEGVFARVDVQLETPAGAVALREWAVGNGRVLVKTQAAPLLLADPWSAQGAAA